MSKEKNVVDYPNSIETRVALLERSIDGINETLKEIKQDLKESRTEFKQEFKNIRSEFKEEFKEIGESFNEIRGHFDKLIAGLYFMFGSSLLAVIYKLIHG